MVYVTAGLLLLFGGLAYFNNIAVREAEDQIYRERIALAQGLAHDIGQDFDFLISDLKLGIEGLDMSDGDFRSATEEFYTSLRQHTESQFFRVCTISLLDEQGNLLATAPITTKAQIKLPEPEMIQLSLSKNTPLFFQSRSSSGSSTHFATVITPANSRFSKTRTFVVVADTVGVKDIHPIIPGEEAGYSMEIVAIDTGMVVAASHSDEVGATSSHFPMSLPYMEMGLGGVEIHETEGGSHVTAMTPLPNGPFYVTLEQPADVRGRPFVL